MRIEGPETAHDEELGTDREPKETMINEPGGVRIVPPDVPKRKGKVGRRKKLREDSPPRANKRQVKQFTWCATSRDEFNAAQQTISVQRFERGEGGGVT